MAIEHRKGTLTMTGITSTTAFSPAKAALAGGRLRRWVDLVEVGAAASVGSTYTFARLPSDCTLSPLSTVRWDDVGTGGATLDIGDGAHADGLATDIAIDAAAGSSPLLEAKGIETFGQPLWQMLGHAADPGGTIDLVATLATAAASAGGTLVFDVYYTVD
ncbi:MAG: hypothetical protein H6842_13290 [Rhodospirillaceae bacterium]|nr:hypothetical protein [Rhodospirillaceae bacterium]